MDNNPNIKTRSPWSWIPTLYFGQGIPYVVVMTLSVIMYKKLGVSNTDIAYYTSWLYLPWVIKPLWSPFIDIFKTKRFWIVALQLMIGASLSLVAFTIPMESYFQWSLAIFWLMAFSSATHDIAADGYYMLALEQHQQAAFVGVRSTFYRIAMITGQGLLIIFAGALEEYSGLEPSKVTIQMVHEVSASSNPTLSQKSQVLAIMPSTTSMMLPLKVVEKSTADSIIRWAKEENLKNGFTTLPKANSRVEESHSWWTENVSAPLFNYLRTHFGQREVASGTERKSGYVDVIEFRMTQEPPDEKPIVQTFDFTTGDNSIGLVEGARLVFTKANWDKPAFAVVQVDPNLKKETSATFVARSGNIPFAWSVTFFLLAGLFIGLFIYHRFILPYPTADRPAISDSNNSVLKEFFRTFGSFFKKKEILIILGFLLFYRFAEAQLVKLVTPFLLDPRTEGGLGLTTSEVGIAYGTIGVICLTLGGLLGGYVISKRGLKFWLWIMVFAIHLPDTMFVYLSYVQPENFLLVCAAIGIEQFGYGFGFTAYMLYMVMISDGPYKTAHYAICTGFMALGMMIPGMFSGALQDAIGYQHFFLWVMASTIPGFIVAMLVKIDPEFGKKKN